MDEDACLLLDALLPVGGAAADARLRLHVDVKTEVRRLCKHLLPYTCCFLPLVLMAEICCKSAKLVSTFCADAGAGGAPAAAGPGTKLD